ncbi:MAG: LamG domain-containing protein, partial [Candidatus Colwellbacteria bacterium]|nr:LamG domain-containing protein [Candidatus Colwellbacteria bacterium]
KDGGTDAGRLEIGSDLNLWRTASGLVGYWPFEGTGAISNGQTVGFTDSSGRNNNGTAYNTNGTGMSFVTGIIGNAIQFDGVDDNVSIPDNASLNFGTSDFSVSAWIFYNGFYNQGSAWNMFIGKGSTQSTGGDAFGLGTGSDNKARFMVRETSNSTINNTGITDGEWHYITAVRAGTTSKIYVDGNIGTDITISGTVSNVFPLVIGRDSTATRCINGRVDDVRIYNRALSVSEIKAIYSAGK